MLLPDRALGAHGQEIGFGHVTAKPSTGELTLRDMAGEQHERFDVVVLQRWMYAEHPDYIRKARALGQIVVNDVDDWFDGLPQSNAAFAATHKRSDAESNREH